VFASWIPEITELAAQRSKYGGAYSKDPRKRYTNTLLPVPQEKINSKKKQQIQTKLNK